MLPIGVDQPLTGKMMRRESDEASQSASPSQSPRQRQRRQPGSRCGPDSPKAAPREAWTAEGDALYSSRPGHDRRVSSTTSRPGTAQKTARGGGGTPTPQMSVSLQPDWQNHTLFGGEKNTNPRAKRGFATTFRRPSSSRATPHSRPIFVVGPNAQDPRICVDINAPGRFGSAERTRYELSWRKANLNEGGKASSGATPATIRNIGNAGRPSSTGRGSGMGGGRSCPPNRPDSVASAGGPFRGPSGPSPLPGNRPPLPTRPMSSTPVQRSFCSPTPPPAPACWSGA